MPSPNHSSDIKNFNRTENQREQIAPETDIEITEIVPCTQKRY